MMVKCCNKELSGADNGVCQSNWSQGCRALWWENGNIHMSLSYLIQKPCIPYQAAVVTSSLTVTDLQSSQTLLTKACFILPITQRSICISHIVEFRPDELLLSVVCQLLLNKAGVGGNSSFSSAAAKPESCVPSSGDNRGLPMPFLSCWS